MMGKTWYNDIYLQSDAWIVTRNASLERFGYRCALCAETENLQVHHNSYEHVGDEDLCDLVVLCAECHRKVHTWLKQKRDLAYHDRELTRIAVSRKVF